MERASRCRRQGYSQGSNGYTSLLPNTINQLVCHPGFEHAWLVLSSQADVPTALSLQPLFRLEGPGSQAAIDSTWTPPVAHTMDGSGCRFSMLTLNVQALSTGPLAAQAKGYVLEGKALALAEQCDRRRIAVIAMQECRSQAGQRHNRWYFVYCSGSDGSREPWVRIVVP